MIDRLWLVRHGESTANVAADAADAAGSEVVEVTHRDADVPLSRVGRDQATALGTFLRASAPDVVWCSSYLRAQETAAISLNAAGLDLRVTTDERLRDRELGVLDTLTSIGVERRYPLEAERRRWLGKFSYRPPGGESWADVALRIRSVLAELDATSDGRTVLVVAHDAVVLLFLYVCLGMTESEILEFSLNHTVINASVTRLTRTAGDWQLEEFAQHDHLLDNEVPVTRHTGDKDPDVH